MARTLIIALVALVVSGPVWAGDFQKGLDAAQKGDFATALGEWEPLAVQGDANAQFNLGLMYANGEGVPKDYKTAIAWYRLAAKQGNVSAQYSLGFMHINGKGVPQDFKTAIKWYILAAENGNASAQYGLGKLYFNGEGTTQDFTRAHMWMNISASEGNENAIEGRKIVAEKMSPTQLETAQRLARECVEKNYKEC